MMKGMQLLFCHIVPTEASAPRLFVNSQRINSPCHYALRESFDKSFVEERSWISLVTLRYIGATIGARATRNTRAHRVYMARRFLARSATTTVTTLPPVNQGFYSVNCRALTSVSH